ncbi:hypothetical protein [Eisenbergiella tayi]|uniref:hypothetical protein n=1 Tax=Eisenbergiella tayi TaxID=1432052 RepID=UPI002A7F08B9|nr:hypothetical protein [Eisenbergiella tayi]
MAFKKKTWVDRMVEYAGRRKITNVTTMAAQIVDVERAEGVVSEEGTAINAVNMNDLEQRTADAFSAVQQDIEGINSDLANGQIEFDLQGGKGVYRQKGADAWLPFSNTLVLMDGTASAAFSGINVTRYSTFVLNNFDYSNYSKIRITNLGPYGYQVTCGTQLITADGTYDVSSLASDKLQVLYRGDTVNPNIMLRIELIP